MALVCLLLSGCAGPKHNQQVEFRPVPIGLHSADLAVCSNPSLFNPERIRVAPGSQVQLMQNGMPSGPLIFEGTIDGGAQVAFRNTIGHWTLLDLNQVSAIGLYLPRPRAEHIAQSIATGMKAGAGQMRIAQPFQRIDGPRPAHFSDDPNLHGAFAGGAIGLAAGAITADTSRILRWFEWENDCSQIVPRAL